MKIHELLDRDPLRTGLANNGQARITGGRDSQVMRELRSELETFVCKGQFAEALQRILEGYLARLDSSRQDGVWVSGFFGSGKSHLLKMLAHLWVNTSFDDGQTARGLAGDRLPSGVRHALREIDTRARRIGPDPVAAAGSLLGGNVGHVRLSVLSILLRARELPEQYPQARFCFWLRGEGLLDRVRASVEAQGRTWERELNNLYVSPAIAKAVMEASPGFATDVKSARQLLIGQFPQPRADISDRQFCEAARQALAPGGGPIPATIVVLDEVQQYINEDSDRAQIVTDLAEALQTQFDSRVLLVASGQSALGGQAALHWLKDRFRTTVQLADAEVEVVTREVLLRKKPSVEPSIQEMLERHAGEVARHLQGTRLAARAEDKQFEVADYPLLRTRRRFWEACFQTTDPSGTRSQLRSQLRILHDSLRAVAERPLGAVVPASDLFRALAQDLVGSNVLLNEINTRIRKLDDGSEEGRLKADLCGVVFLIGKLPREEGADQGVRADADTLADLLLDDIGRDSGKFRNRVARMLDGLAEEGVLMRMADEYRIQTREGAEWERAFREERTRLSANEVEIAARRDQLLGEAVQNELKGVRLSHGEAGVTRKLRAHFGAEDPDARDGGGRREVADAVWIWVRDGWSCSEANVRADARRKGMEDATLYVHLAKRGADQFRAHITSAEAARKVLAARGVPSSAEGREARESMNSRLAGAEAARDRIVEETVRMAKVFQGGGAEVFGDGLSTKAASGAESSLARLFPRFADADHRGWGTALRRIREGTGTPFGAVGWEGSVSGHPVAREVMLKVGSGATGAKVRAALEAAPFGWPRDAVDAALLGLLADGHLKAERNGRPVKAAEVTQQLTPGVRFLPEKVRLTTRQRTAVRGLFQRLGVRTRSGEEADKALAFLSECRKLAHAAGGDAPLPPVPDTRFLDDLSGLAGSEQLAALLAERERIETSTDLWKELGERAPERIGAWKLAEGLHRHADGELEEVAAEVGRQLDAIRKRRTLLDDTDHVQPCAVRLGDALRGALGGLHEELSAAVDAVNARLADDATWRRVEADDREEVLAETGLTPPPALRVGTNEALRKELDARGLAAWRSEIDAIPTRESRALAAAARRLPDDDSVTFRSVRVRRGTLGDAEAVRAWLAEHERKLNKAVREGPVIVE
ncbi:MAG: BREX system P-loop protein BrxC [Gemmatimonadetes bacterium]|nr:BREX system P-loop protein BrxC [Candidatus Palauibacter australiensis]